MTFLISFFKDWPVDCLLLLDLSRPCPDSAPEIGDCEIEHLASSATDDGLDHVEGEPLGHLKGDLGRDPAANAATSSWRTWIHSIFPWRRIESVIPLRLSPTTPQMRLTPGIARVSAN